MNIFVIGAGYVGLSNALLFAKNHRVFLVDIDLDRIRLIRDKSSPFKDKSIQDALSTCELTVMHVSEVDFKLAELIIIATPTDFNPEHNTFDASSVVNTIQSVDQLFQGKIILIKSTVPVGFTERIRQIYPRQIIIFSPEFLREGYALSDNLNPSRIIIGDRGPIGQKLALLYKNEALNPEVPVLLTSSTEAEAIKLFSNTYLAMRIAFFNELDSFAEIRNLDTRQIIEGVGLDSRIGEMYNNPSFGYGGYCLPKDSKQLLANYENIPQTIMSAIVTSNVTRKKHILQQILARQPKTVGIYRLSMKRDSDNTRESAVLDIMVGLMSEGIRVIVYEPDQKSERYNGFDFVAELDLFKLESDLIVANRMHAELFDVSYKVYTRDLYNRD